MFSDYTQKVRYSEWFFIITSLSWEMSAGI
jgi:hypothetical protein